MAAAENFEELEYHLTFPSPSPRSYEDEPTGKASDSRDTKEPVVILLGWAGCQDKYLEKYSAIYNSKGCITIRYIAPLDKIFFATLKLQPIAIQLLELISDLSLEENPTFIHMFSNGGCTVYQFIEQAVNNDSRFKNLEIKGCVVDSAPTKYRIMSGARALLVSMNYNMVLKYIITFFWFISVLFLNLVNRGPGKVFWKNMMEGTCHYPMLFLYSKADEVVPYTDVENVIKSRKDRGVEIQSVCWDDSPHVKHLITHREPYIKQCYDFIDYCLQK